jgi:phage gp46-like protein
MAWHSDADRIDLQPRPADRLTWLENAVTISLFTDARAAADDEIPGGDTDRRGHWADMWLDEGESLGSRLWLLKREKVTQAVINKARDYCMEALEWLVDADHLQAVNVTAERGGLNRIHFQIDCQLPDGSWVQLFREHVNAI